MAKWQCYKCEAPISWDAINLANMLDKVVKESGLDKIPNSFIDYLTVTGPPVPAKAFDEEERMMLCDDHTAEAILLLFGRIQQPATLF